MHHRTGVNSYSTPSGTSDKFGRPGKCEPGILYNQQWLRALGALRELSRNDCSCGAEKRGFHVLLFVDEYQIAGCSVSNAGNTADCDLLVAHNPRPNCRCQFADAPLHGTFFIRLLREKKVADFAYDAPVSASGTRTCAPAARTIRIGNISSVYLGSGFSSVPKKTDLSPTKSISRPIHMASFIRSHPTAAHKTYTKLITPNPTASTDHLSSSLNSHQRLSHG